MPQTAVHTVFPAPALPSALRRSLGKMWQLRLGVIGAVLIAAFLFTALFVPWLAPHDPYEQNITQRLLPPAWMDGGKPEHILGTDNVGRDLFSRILYGTRISLVVGLSAVVLQVLIGVLLGDAMRDLIDPHLRKS